jgi:hypothetical protein
LSEKFRTPNLRAGLHTEANSKAFHKHHGNKFQTRAISVLRIKMLTMQFHTYLDTISYPDMLVRNQLQDFQTKNIRSAI